MRVIGIIIGIILHMPGYGVDKRTVIVAMTGVHHQTGRFVHYHQILVLIYYIKGDVFGDDFILIAWTVHHHSDYIHRLHLIAAFHSLAVRHHEACIGSLLDAIARGVRQAVEQILVHPASSPCPLVHHHTEVFIELRLVTHRLYVVPAHHYLYHPAISFYHHGIYNLTIYNLRLESDVYQNQDSSAAESSDNTGSTVPPTESTPRESAFKAPPSPTISVSTAPVGTFSPMES